MPPRGSVPSSCDSVSDAHSDQSADWPRDFVTHHPLDYDHARAAAKMRAAGLPAAYARTLEDGLWPDMRVLPEPERRLCARPLTPGAVHWSAGDRRAAR